MQVEFVDAPQDTTARVLTDWFHQVVGTQVDKPKFARFAVFKGLPTYQDIKQLIKKDCGIQIVIYVRLNSIYNKKTFDQVRRAVSRRFTNIPRTADLNIVNFVVEFTNGHAHNVSHLDFMFKGLCKFCAESRVSFIDFDYPNIQEVESTESGGVEVEITFQQSGQAQGYNQSQE